MTALNRKEQIEEKEETTTTETTEDLEEKRREEKRKEEKERRGEEKKKREERERRRSDENHNVPQKHRKLRSIGKNAFHIAKIKTDYVFQLKKRGATCETPFCVCFSKFVKKKNAISGLIRFIFETNYETPNISCKRKRLWKTPLSMVRR